MRWTSEADAALVEGMRRGDEGAFARLYAAHQPPLYRYALQMCGAAGADDVVQDTFMALLRGRRFDPGRGTLRAYLFGIARHHVLKRLSLARLESPIEGEEAVDAHAAGEATPFDDMSRAEVVAQVRAAIRTLPPVYREAIVLCELEALDYATAAAIMECPVGTVRSRLHRARRLLVAKLAVRRAEVRLKPDATDAGCARSTDAIDARVAPDHSWRPPLGGPRMRARKA